MTQCSGDFLQARKTGTQHWLIVGKLEVLTCFSCCSRLCRCGSATLAAGRWGERSSGGAAPAVTAGAGLQGAAAAQVALVAAGWWVRSAGDVFPVGAAWGDRNWGGEWEVRASG